MGIGPRYAGALIFLLSFAPIAWGESDRELMLRAIRLTPHDNTVRLAYADLLEESGKEKMAAFIRADVELSRGWKGEELVRKTKERNQALREALPEWTEGWWFTGVGRRLRTTPDYRPVFAGEPQADYVVIEGMGLSSTAMRFERGMPRATIALSEYNGEDIPKLIGSLPRETFAIELQADPNWPEKLPLALEAVGKLSAGGFVTELTLGGRNAIGQVGEFVEGLQRFPANARIGKLSFEFATPDVAQLAALARSPVAKTLAELHMPRPEARGAYREFFLAHRNDFPEMEEAPKAADMTRWEWAAGRRTLAGVCLRGLQAVGRAVSIPFSGLVR